MKLPTFSSLFALALVSGCSCAYAQSTGFVNTGAGPYDYNTAANWVNGDINGIWSSDLTLTAAQTVTFATDTTLPTGLTFNYAGNFGLTLRGTANRTLTLGSDILVSTASPVTITIGSGTSGQNLNVALGGNRNFTINTGNTLRLVNTVSGAFGIAVQGGGTLGLAGANTFTGGILLSSGGLNIENSAALGTGALTLSDGVVLDAVGADRTTTNNNALNLNGSFTFKGSKNLNLGTGAITLAGPITVTTNGSTLTLGGSISGGTIFDITKAGAGTLNYTADLLLASSRTVNVTAGQEILSGLISGPSSSTLTVSGGGTLALAGANTFSGGVNLSAGALSLNNDAALGTGTLTVAAGTTLDANAARVTTNNNAIQLNGDFTFKGTNTLDLGTGTVTLAQPLTLTTTASTLTFGGPIAGGTIFDITKAGNGNLTYTGMVNVASSPTLTVNAGTETLSGPIVGGSIFNINKAGAGTLALTGDVAVTGTQTITVAAGTENLTGVLSGTGNLIKAGAGVLQLSAANTFSGNTSVTAGTLRLSGATGALAASAITASSGTTVNFDNSAAGVTGTTRAASVSLLGGAALTNSGNSTANSADVITGALRAGGGSAGYSTVTLATNSARNYQLSVGSLDRSGQGVFLIRGTNLGVNPAGTVANSTNLLVTGPTPTLIGGAGLPGSTNISIIPYAIGGTSTTDTGTTFVTYGENGIRPLSITTEYTTTLVDGDTSANNVRLTAATALTSQTTINSLIFQPGSTAAISGGTLRITSGALLINPNNTNLTATISSNIDFGSAQGVIGVSNNRASNITGKVSGTGGLVIYSNSGGSSNLSIGGVNANTSDYTGDTYLYADLDTFNNGGGNSFLPNGTRSGDLYIYATLHFGNGTVINGLNGTGVVDYGHSGSANITVGSNGANGDFSGRLATGTGFNSYSLTKVGAGTQNLSSTASSYAAGTNITGGTLQVASIANGGQVSSIGASSSSAGNLIINGATLRFVGTTDSSSDRLFTIGASGATLDASGQGTLSLGTAGGNNVSSEVGSRAGTRVVDDPVVTNITNTADLVVGARVTGTGIVAGTTITAINGNTITLSNAPTVASSNSLAFITPRTLTLTGSNSGANTIGSVLANTSAGGALGVTKTGSGAWVLAQANTYTGPTTVISGSLSGTVSNAFGATSAVAVNSGARLLLGASGVVNDAAPISLGSTGGSGAGGTLAVGAGVSEGTALTKSGGVLSTANAAQSSAGLGTLSLLSNSTLDFGVGTSGTLVFTDFSSNGFRLDITGYLNTGFSFATDSSGGINDDHLVFSRMLTMDELSRINFGSGFVAQQINLDGAYYEVGALAVPEPTSLSLAAAGLGFAAFRRWRRAPRSAKG